MNKHNIQTVPTENGWAVKQEGQPYPLSQSRTKAEAEKIAITFAKAYGVEHVIHGKDGKIQDKDSYGNDPHPPIDKKH